MENNKTKYLLGLMLALVWGLVAYRLYDKYFGKKVNAINNTPIIFEEKAQLKQDSFTLLLDYRDPFKYAEIQQEERPIFRSSFYENHYPTVSIEAPKNEIKQMPVIIFPDIAYKGNIKSKSGRIVALVSINGNISNLAINDVWKEVQLTNIYDDSIKVLYKNTYKTISKIQ